MGKQVWRVAFGKCSFHLRSRLPVLMLEFTSRKAAPPAATWLIRDCWCVVADPDVNVISLTLGVDSR